MPGLGRAEDRRIYMMGPDGRNRRLIVAPAQNIRSIAWSPSGQEIAYTAGFSIFIVDMQGVTVREIPGPSPCGGLDRSPDGARFVFTMSDPPRDPDVCDLWLMNVDGTGRRRITNSQTELFNPRWSCDGRHIACDGTLDDWLTSNLIIFDSEGGNERNITELGDSEFRPVRAPDGARLAYVKWAGRGSHFGTIWSKEPDGSNACQPTPHVMEGIRRLTWSPDGRSIAYSAGDFPFGQSIYVMRADGGDSRRITGQLAPGETLPDWFHPASLSLSARSLLPTTWGLVKELGEH